MSWWQIDLRCNDADEDSGLLDFDGLTGFEVLGPALLRCFLEGDERHLDEFSRYASSVGLQVAHQSEIQKENWVQRCKEVWTPIQVGSLELVPVTDLESGKDVERRSGQLLLIPGMGFGSGHHTSTRLALRLMQNDEMRALAPKTALDVGTGNGVLGIAAALELGARTIATDIDPLALENARDNIALNECAALVTLEQGTFPASNAAFDLVTANIYAEVLCELEPMLARSTRAGGLMILSGIMSEKAHLIESAFAAGWEKVRRLDESGWSAFLLRRPNR